MTTVKEIKEEQVTSKNNLASKRISKLGILLRRYRNCNRIRNKTFAHDININEVNLYKIENSERDISELNFIKFICYFLYKESLTEDIKEAIYERIDKQFIKNIFNKLFISNSLIKILTGRFEKDDIDLLLNNLKRDMINFKSKSD